MAQPVVISTRGEDVQAFVELSMTHAALGTEHDSTELASNAQYRQLSDRLSELSGTLGDLIGVLSESEFELFLDGLVRRMTEDDQ